MKVTKSTNEETEKSTNYGQRKTVRSSCSGGGSGAIDKKSKDDKQSKDDKRKAVIAAMQQHLSAGQPGTTSGGAAKKHMSRSLLYSLLFTVHAATGKTGTNLLLKFAIHAWEKDNLKDLLDDLPVDGTWYDKKEKLNLSKVSTPELAEKVISKVQAACPDSAANMSGSLVPPAGYEAPTVTLVVVPNLTINSDLIERVTLFFVGKMFVLKDCLKSKFSVRYGDIEWGGQVSAAWYVHLTDSSEETIANWLKSMGWNVILIDERDDDDE